MLSAVATIATMTTVMSAETTYRRRPGNRQLTSYARKRVNGEAKEWVTTTVRLSLSGIDGRQQSR
jgi:hypothetical protein